MSIVLHRGMRSLYFMTIAMTTSPCPYCKNSICAEWSVSQIWSASQIWSHVCIFQKTDHLSKKPLTIYLATLLCCGVVLKINCASCDHVWERGHSTQNEL